MYPPSIVSALENIYISPLESCNLNCKYCYTHKTKNILSSDQILKFIHRYNRYLSGSSEASVFDGLQRDSIDQPKKHLAQKNKCSLKSVLFCGGEVFLLPDFPKLVNQLIRQNIFVTIITNGTINRLSEIENPSNCQLLVSLDGPKTIHDQNRGWGNFQKSKDFIQHALNLGFPVEIMFLINSTSYPHKDSFDLFNLRKTYLTDRLHSLTKEQVLDIKINYPTYPAKNFGCFQLALQSDGFIYGCCESSKPLAKLTDPPQTIINNFVNSLTTCTLCKYFDRSNVFLGTQSCEAREYPKKSLQDQICMGCSDPSFLCGYKSETSCNNCPNVVKSFCS